MRKLDINVVIILLWPFLLFLIHADWIFTQVYQGLIDPWYYLGFFLNLRQYLELFPVSYQGTRLPWIIPGYFAYKLFSPVVANYFLHLFVYYLSLFALYASLSVVFNRRVGLFCSLIMGSYYWFLTAAGWDYVDGIGCAYLLLTVMFLTFSVIFKRKKPWLFFAGVGYGALLGTNLFLVVFTPFLIAYYFYLNMIKGKKFSLDFLYFPLGAFFLIVVLGLFNFYFGGNLLFFSPSLRMLSRLVMTNNKYTDITYAWLKDALWLAWPNAIFLLVFVSSFLRRKMVNKFTISYFFQLQFIVLYLFFVALNLSLRGPVLQYPFYASYLVPFMFLAIGSLIATYVKKLSKSSFSVLILGLLIFLPLSVWLGKMNLLKLTLYPLLLPSILLMFAFYGWLYFRNKISIFLFVLLIALANTLVFQVVPQTSFSGARGFSAVMESLQFIRGLNPDADARYWYSKDSRLFGINRAVVSTYLWGARLINEEFPEVKESKNLKPGTKIFMITEKSEDYRMGQLGLQQFGLTLELVEQKVIMKESEHLFISLTEVKEI